MGGLSNGEQNHLESIVKRRVGARSDAASLVRAYLDAMARNALFRTTDDGPVPTSLSVERSLLLIQISRELNRVIEDYEIQALFRVTPSQAKTMRTTLFATYPDIANELALTWSLVDARQDGRQKTPGFTGTVIVFTSDDRRDAFVDYSKRMGISVENLLGNAEQPWRVAVGDEFPKSELPKK